MNITHFETVVGLGAGTIVAVGGAVAYARPVLRKVADFLDDWQGHPPRPGVKAVPGVMERINGLDEGQLHIIERLSKVEHELTPNSGGSLKDQVNTIAQVVTAQPGGRT